MGITDTLYKYLPQSWFIKIRNIYYSYRNKYNSPLSEEQFKELLVKRLKIERGMIVYIHSSIDKMNIGFSAYRLIEILQEIVGKEGTLVFPCWHFKGRAEDHIKSSNPVFNVKKSPTTMGLIPELARRFKNSKRSLHPTTSTVAIGFKADELTKDHHIDKYPNGHMSPMSKMLKHKCRIIGLGEKVVSLSFVHVVEDEMKKNFPWEVLMKRIFKLDTIDYDGKIITSETLIPHKKIGSRNIPVFFRKNISKEACYSFRSKGVNYFAANPQLLLTEMRVLAQRGKTIYI